MEEAGALRSLRDRPYELLRELDRRARAAAQGKPDAAASGAEWVGIAFRLGGEAFLLAREETREVMGYPAAVTRVPGAKNWIRGLSNVRGQLLPVIDVRAFLGLGRHERHPRDPRAGRQPPRDSGRARRRRGDGIPAGSTKASSPPTFRRRCCAASATSRARSSAAPRSGPYSACAACSRASSSCRPRRPDGRAQPNPNRVQR